MKALPRYLATASIAAATCSAAAQPEPDGKSYTVPLGVLTHNSDNVSSTTGQLVFHKTDEGTTRAILMVTSGIGGSKSFILNRADAPDEMAPFFGSMDMLNIEHFQGNLSATRELIINLTDDSGKPRGFHVQLIAADGSPFTNAAVEYESRLTRNSPLTTGTAELSADGKMFIPQFSAPGDIFPSSANHKFYVSETTSGTSTIVPNDFQRLTDRDDVTTLSVPFLNEAAAAGDQFDLYTAQFFDPNGNPASKLKFRMHLAGYPSSSTPFNRQWIITGSNGELRVALPKPDTDTTRTARRQLMLEAESRDITNGLFANRLAPGEHKIIRIPKRVTVELLDENGNIENFDNYLGKESKIPHLPFGRIYPSESRGMHGTQLNLNRQATSAALEAVELDPGTTYTVQVAGRFYTEQYLHPQSTHLTFPADPVSFKVTGTVENAAGCPIGDVYVGLGEPIESAKVLSALGAPDSDPGIAWEKTRGNFDQLGFYMAKTQADGSFEIKGNYLSNRALLQVWPVTQGLTVGKSIRPLDISQSPPGIPVERLSGEINTGSTVIDTTATITVEVDLPVNTPNRSSYPPGPWLSASLYRHNSVYADDGTTRQVAKGWIVQPTSSTLNTWSIPVPAETTFTLRLHTSGSADMITTDILSPLSTGEIRDLGTLKSKQN